MSEWKTYRLGDICQVLNGRAYKQEELLNQGPYPVLRVGNIFQGNNWYYSDLELPDDKYCYNGDLLYAWSCGFAPYIWKGKKSIYHYHIWKLKENSQIIDKLFFYYYLIIHTKYNLGGTHGSVMLHLTKKDFENQTLHLPPLDEQRRIAGILGSLDDKIELNRRINANLEAQAQALFRSWFVDFEPFRDGPFVDSELGKIPQGWKVGTFQDIINITSGKRPPLKVDKCTSEAYIPIYGASSIQAYTTSFLRNEDLLLIGRVGTLGIVQKVTGLSWPSDNTLIITSPFYEYSYQILKTIDFNKLNRGSTQPLITQTDIKNQIILLPSNEVLYRYEKISANMFSLNKKNNSEIKTLSALRDTLLPKLMAGEIKI